MNGGAVTRSRLRELLEYDPTTGVFTWCVNRRKVRAGNVAGGLSGGYRTIKIDYVAYRAARLAWFFVHGKWPLEVDHENGVKDDDRIDNLRNGDHAFNMQNKRKAMANNKSCGLLWG